MLKRCPDRSQLALVCRLRREVACEPGTGLSVPADWRSLAVRIARPLRVLAFVLPGGPAAKMAKPARASDFQGGDDDSIPHAVRRRRGRRDIHRRSGGI